MLRETVAKLTLRSPASFCNEEPKIEYLYNAVAGVK